jgi:UDP-N-acetyl-D-mannosaminuronic acid dehydrogenase
MPSNPSSTSTYDICVIGGAGHVGAPLAIVLAARGFRTLIYDINDAAVRSIMDGRFPFLEHGGESLLRQALAAGRLSGSSCRDEVAQADVLVITIGTPIDEFQNPVWDAVTQCVTELLPHMRNTKLLILRSTVAPGTTDRLQQLLSSRGYTTAVAFCPERVVQGQAIDEIQRMAQIISGTSSLAEEQAAGIFGHVATSVVRMKPIEAEFAKLFCNAYRYIQFAASNQFFMMAHAAGCDYGRIVAGIKEDYPRMNGLPGAGFAAGPCLLKDTLQLAAISSHQFGLGYAAIHVNEGLPSFVVNDIQRRFPLPMMTVGILGMAFKAGSDDIRSSLSYKLKKLLKLHAREVLTTDPFVTEDRELRPLDEVIARSDLLVVAAPHEAYARVREAGKPVIDIWSVQPSAARLQAP